MTAKMVIILMTPQASSSDIHKIPPRPPPPPPPFTHTHTQTPLLDNADFCGEGIVHFRSKVDLQETKANKQKNRTIQKKDIAWSELMALSTLNN